MRNLKYKLLSKLYKLFHKDTMPLKVEMLRSKGMKIGDNARLFNDPMTSEPYLISIGNNVTISSGTRFVTHDNSICKCDNSIFTDVVGKIDIGNNVFIGMGSIIMYGVSIADNTIIGSGSVVTKSIFDEGGVWAGNPAKKITTLNAFYQKNLSHGFDFKIDGKQASYDKRRKMILDNKDKIILR